MWGGMNSWATDFVTDILDINHHIQPGKRVWTGDINESTTWSEFETDTFDFAICSHTLEDIRNPFFAAAQMARVSKAGFIAVPNRFQEFHSMEDLRYRSYWHHRWIFAVENQVLVGIPKLAPAIVKFDTRPKIKVRIINKFNKLRGIRFNPFVAYKQYRVPKNPFMEPIIRDYESYTEHGMHELGFLWVENLLCEYANGDYADSGYFEELEKISNMRVRDEKCDNEVIRNFTNKYLSIYS